MTKITKEKHVWGNGTMLSFIRRSANRQQMTEDFGPSHAIAACGNQMMSQADYGLSPLTEEEVRQLPAAHQYSS